MTEPARTPAPVGPDAATARFLAQLSHELRTPLSAIIGYADAMRARAFGPLGEAYVEKATTIWEAGRHLLELVSDIADLARIAEGRVDLAAEPFDAAGLVRETWALMQGGAAATGVTLMLDDPPQLSIMADRRAIRQIILNLIANALKFTPAGGTVTLGARTDDGNLLLTVRDTGVGMGAEAPARPDGTAQSVGDGLGLALARALAGAHGGTIAIESAPGTGTIVTVRLPAPDRTP